MDTNEDSVGISTTSPIPECWNTKWEGEWINDALSKQNEISKRLLVSLLLQESRHLSLVIYVHAE